MVDVERLKHDPDYWEEAGAPEEATHYIVPNSQAWSKAGFFVEADDRYIRIGSGGHYRLKEDLHMYSLIPRPTRKQWSGPEDGLPPVGSKVEGYINYGASSRWREVEVLKHNNEEAAVFCANGGCGFLAWCKEFRPLKSEKERVVEAVYERITPNGDYVKELIGDIYDAGALKMPEEEQ